MAEQEVVKHTKKVYKIWSSREHSLLHKIKEFVIEIVIIVFAVTLSIWLHDRSEHAHQQKEVKDFLLGLKEDLKSDMGEMGEDKKGFAKNKSAFVYITSVKLHETLSMDSIKKYAITIHSTTSFITNSGRFEGFKSAGKIGAIENKVLQNDIMDLYEEDIPNLLMSTDVYNKYKQKLNDFYNKNVKQLTDSTSNSNIVLSEDEAQNISFNLTDTHEINTRYDSCINKIKKIIGEIDRAYGE